MIASIWMMETHSLRTRIVVLEWLRWKWTIGSYYFYNFFDAYVLFASLNKLSEQLPLIKKRFQQYTAFAEVNTVEQLTGKNPKEYLQTKYINKLRSMLYLNTADGFKGIPLPKVAQQSSIEDILVDPEKKTVSYVGNYFDFVV